MRRLTFLLLLLLLTCGCRVSDSFSLVPGQQMFVGNLGHRTVRVQAEYPVEIRTGDCLFPHTVDIEFTCPVADLYIRDTRPDLLIWAKANTVTVSASRF